jgi:hypothetical protein
LTNWFLTTKSRESTWFPWVQVACHIPLKSSQRGLQLCFRLHFNRRSVEKVMGPQSRESPKLENFGTPSHLGVLGQKAIWMWPSWRGTKYTIRGKVVVSSKFELWWVLWVRVCPWLILAPKVLQLCINHLVLVLCRSVWVIEACQLFLVPFRSSNTPLYPSNVLRARERAPIPCFFVVLCLGFTFESFKKLGVR